jgi:hypothetical protein
LRSTGSRPSLIEQIRPERAARSGAAQALLRLFVQDADLVLEVLLHQIQLVLLDLLRAIVLLDALAREDADADDDASIPAGRSSDASFTSPAFSPKIARAASLPA